MQINTVCGPIRPEELGLTSMHDHILCDASIFRVRAKNLGIVTENPPFDPNDRLSLGNRGRIRHNMALAWDNLRLDDQEVALGEVADYKAAGGSAIMEVSVPGLRSTSQDVLALRRISETTGVHIVAATGLYSEDSWPERFRQMTIDQYADYMQEEIENGIGDTGIKPGQIKVAYEGPTPQADMFLRAAVRVSRESGLSLQIHKGMFLTPDDVPNIILPILAEENANPERTILCHMQTMVGGFNLMNLVSDPTAVPFNLGLLREILDKGYNICIDTFGHDWELESLGILNSPDWYLMAAVFALVKAGYAKQIVLGNDVFQKMELCRGGGHGYTRLPGYVVPALQVVGMSEVDTRQMTVDNPARILAF